jgi:aryl carrier-like protein
LVIMHPDDVPDPHLSLASTSGDALPPREAADTPDNGDRRRELSAFLPSDRLVPRRPENRGGISEPSPAAALPYEDAVVRIRELWADVLGGDSSEDIPLDANFLELGGNSLLLVMLWEQLQPIAGGRLKLADLFHRGTVLAQAELLTARPEHAAPAPAAQHPSRPLLAQLRAATAGGGVA